MSMPDQHNSRTNDPDACPELLELAAFADGRIDAETQKWLALHIAACDRCADVVIAAGENHVGDAMVLVPSHILANAKALLSGPSIIKSHRRPWVGVGFHGFVATAAAIAICVLGYQVGSSLNVDQVDPANQLALELSFQLFDEAHSDDGELQLFALSSQGVVQ